MKKIEIQKNVYYDSVSLMLLTRDVKLIKDINDANICMGTNHNKELLENIGLLDNDSKKSTPNDLIIAIEGTENAVSEALEFVKNNINKKKESSKNTEKYSSLKKAIENNENSNLVILSIPGDFAADEAETALNLNKNVMMFSDNVSIEDEVRLKKIAKEKNLLMMGPDCGTAIINGKPICFANKVRSGNIGIVGASGTGIQEVSTLIDKQGCGISQAIGTGGRDLSKDVNGIMMELGIDALTADPKTEVIVLISKPPHPEVAEKIINKVKTIKKPVVINFLGEERKSFDNIKFCSTLDQTAITACSLSGSKDKKGSTSYGEPDMLEEIELLASQKYLRALYTGGTLCDEAMILAVNELNCIYSNTPIKNCKKLDDPFKSKMNTFIDLGDDVFTQGKPHPMIDPETRNNRIVSESLDPETAVILLDFVLGYGSHDDPVGATIPYIKKAKENNPGLYFIASITGTKQDPQNLDKQAEKLLAENVIIASCNAEASKLAISIIKEINK